MTIRRQQLRAVPDLGLTQRLALTPSLLQKIELLTLSKLELEELLNRELQENPLLEDGVEAETAIEQATPQPELTEGQQQELDRKQEMEDYAIEALFEDYYEPSSYVRREYEEIEKPSFEAFLVKPPSLYDHLSWQLGVCDAPARTKEIAQYIIGDLDENGYLQITLQELCELAGCTLEEAEEALRLVQGFDPVGVASRDVRECLLIQLQSKGLSGSLAERIVLECLPLVQERDLKGIASRLGCTLEEVKDALEVIRRLAPFPGQKYNPSNAQYVEPEVYVVKVDDRYEIILNEDGMPVLRLNPTYRELLRGNALTGEAKDFLRERLRSAVDLMRSVHQRRQTIYRVCEVVVKRQKEFLEHGIEHLKPMLIKDVAQELGVHPSTISRVVTNKYIHTPQGLMELRKFFTSGIETTDGQKLSVVQLRHRIKQIIEGEDKQKPYSDDEIAKLLASQGVVINRRTVAKYREQMGIPGSRERKTLHGSA